MANTWIAYAPALAHAAANRVYCQIFATASNTQTIKIRRIWLINAQTTGVTGALGTINVKSVSTVASGGTPTTITPVPYDTTNTAVNANITINFGSTTTGTVVNTYMSIPFGSEEPATGTFKFENFYSSPNTALIWDAGYEDSNIDPLTIPASTAGGIVVDGTMTAVGNLDTCIEFTLE